MAAKGAVAGVNAKTFCERLLAVLISVVDIVPGPAFFSGFGAV